MRKTNSRGNFRGSDDWLDKEPTRTACTEIAGNDTAIPKEAWAEHGEFDEAEPSNGMDTGIFENDPHDPEVHHVDLENLSEEDIYPDRHDNTEDEREANRDPEWNPNKVAEAGANLMKKLELFSPTRQMYDVVGAYMQRLECRMDAVINYCLNNKRDKDIVEAALEFAEKMRKYFPEISKKAKARLIADAQMEQQLQRRVDGPAYRLGKTIFNSNWERLLRAN